MADGIPKPIGSLQNGDILYDSIITSVNSHYIDTLYVINNGLLKASPGHIHILSDGSLLQSDSLQPGQYLIDKYNSPVEIKSIDVIYGTFEVINISTNTETYIANGIRTHNKVSCP